ncbi:MAG: hypothetical protein M3512_13690 [Bacteroidota bacterium]|nr:hypothetical protein [Bacteroidota bacterium]
MESFNSKNKKIGKIVNHIKSLSKSADSYEALIDTQTFDEKNKLQTSGEYTISCNNGIVSLDLKSLIPQESLKAYDNMDLTFVGDHLEMPSNFNIGDKLKEGNLTCEVRDKESGKLFSTLNLVISDRIVEAKETVTTPSGTYDCFKISYNLLMNNNMMGINIPMKMKGIDYLTEKEGVVRSESFNKNGKLMGYTLLTKVE